MDFLLLRLRTFIRVNWFRGLLTILYIQRGIHFASSNLHFFCECNQLVLFCRVIDFTFIVVIRCMFEGFV